MCVYFTSTCQRWLFLGYSTVGNFFSFPFRHFVLFKNDRHVTFIIKILMKLFLFKKINSSWKCIIYSDRTVLSYSWCLCAVLVNHILSNVFGFCLMVEGEHKEDCCLSYRLLIWGLAHKKYHISFKENNLTSLDCVLYFLLHYLLAHELFDYFPKRDQGTWKVRKLDSVNALAC